MGRILLSICALVVATGLASLREAPDAQGVAAPSPAVERQTEQARKDAKDEPAAAVPVTIVESPEQAVAAERRERESRQHDTADLDAQVRAADAAEQQVLPSWFAAALSFAGTGLIVWSLHEARTANRIAREIGSRQLRPWMLFESIKQEQRVDGTFTIWVVWKNFGLSPGIDVEVVTSWCTYIPNEEDHPVRDIADANNVPVMVGVVAPTTIAPNIIEPIGSEQFWNQRLSLTARCRYRDAATNTRHESLVTLTCWVIRGPNDTYAVRWARLAPDSAT